MKFDKLKEILKDDQYFINGLKSLINSASIGNLQRSQAPIYLQRSATQRIDEIKQPKGGYLPIKLFKEQKLFSNNLILKYKSSDDAKRFASSVGLVVDYVSRFLYSKDIIESFKISFLSILEYLTQPNYTTKTLDDDECISLFKDFKQKLFSVEKLDLNTNNPINIEIIQNMFAIVRLDAVYRANYEKEPLWERTPYGVQLTTNKNHNIPAYIYGIVLICLQRSLNFYNRLQNITFGECFGNGELISTGDCDFISNDTIWDMKVSSVNIYDNPSANKWTLQILIYYLMLKHHSHHNFDKYHNVQNVGIFNPYLNVYYIINVKEFVNSDYIREIENEIIGFDWKISDGYRIDNLKNNELIIQLLKRDYPNIRIYNRYNDKD